MRPLLKGRTISRSGWHRYCAHTDERLWKADGAQAAKLDGRSHVKAHQLPNLITVAFRSAVAILYCLAARRDEKNGFAFAAAQEWRNAAELFAPIASMADRCWMEWERIMLLPRHLAGPIV